MKLLCLQSTASRWFSVLGKTIGNHPLPFVISPIVFAAVLLTGIVKLSFNRDMMDLYTAINKRGSQEREMVNSIFPRNYSSYAPSFRETEFTNFISALITAKDGGNIFRKKCFRDIVALDEIIKTFNVTWEGKFINYTTICGKRNGECVKNPVLDLRNKINENGLKNSEIKYPFKINGGTFYFKEYVSSLGGIKLDDNSFVEEAKAIRLFYLLDISNQSKSSAIEQWRKGLFQISKNLNFQFIQFNCLNLEEYKHDFIILSQTLFYYIPFILLAMTMFSFASCMTDNWIRSKPVVGACSCISAMLAIGGGFGLCLLLGFPFLDYHLLLAFAFLATEVDDAFILIAAWRQTEPKDAVAKRMQQTYCRAGVSITITSITNLLSFIIGIFTPFYSIRYLCIYASFTICFTYAFLITFFGGCLALDGYREERKLHPLTFRSTKDQETKNSTLYVKEEEEYFSRKFRCLGSALNYPLVKLFVMFLFFANIAIGLWGFTFIKYGGDVGDALSSNSTINEITTTSYKYFNLYSYPIHIIFDYPLNYADPKVQDSIEEIMKNFEAHPHIADSSLRMSWLKYYKMFSNSGESSFPLGGYNISDKADFIDGLHNVFLKFPQAEQFKQDIVFNENFTEIIASRFLIPLKDVSTKSVEMEISDYIHEIADKSPIPFRVFCLFTHITELAQVIKETTLMTAILASSLIFIVFFLFVPNVSCSLCISFVVICMFCETVGYMSMWNVKLDVCSLITLIVCIGFSINYPTHISFSFVEERSVTAENRTMKALYQVGMPIFQGTFSTILGIIVLAFQNYYVVQSVFKLVFLMTLQTAFHSIFLIPVLLSLIGVCDQSLSYSESTSQAITPLRELN